MHSSPNRSVSFLALAFAAWLVPLGCFTARVQFSEPRALGGGSGESGGTGGGSGGGTGGGTGGVMIIPGDPVTGAPGIWENVTPAMINLTANYPQPGRNFGAQDILADPVRPGTFYGFVCFQGVWKSTDWGLTWTKVSRDGNLEKGKPWGEAIAPDGSYMLASAGDHNGGAWRSTDGGATWTGHPQGGGDDPYMFDINPADKNHVISTTHSTNLVHESKDGGRTWSSRGAVSGSGVSGYVFFITTTTWLFVNQSGSSGANGTRRTTNSGASWTKVGNIEHPHGNEQIYVDPDNGAIYVPSEMGIYRSTDQGATFTQVSPSVSASIFATGTKMYAMRSGATQGGDPPTLMVASRSDGTRWTAMPTPPKMTNGAKRASTMLDPGTGKWVILGGHWLAGFWRFIEE